MSYVSVTPWLLSPPPWLQSASSWLWSWLSHCDFRLSEPVSLEIKLCTYGAFDTSFHNHCTHEEGVPALLELEAQQEGGIG